MKVKIAQHFGNPNDMQLFGKSEYVFVGVVSFDDSGIGSAFAIISKAHAMFLPLFNPGLVTSVNINSNNHSF